MSVAVTNHAEIQAAYKANYNRIAKDHVAYARVHDGANPFMEPALAETLEAATEQLIRRYVTPGARILDAGCGPGTLLARLTEYDHLWGADLSDDYLNYAVGLDGTVRWRRCDLAAIRWCPESYFDAVICADVLEHVLDEHQVLRELTRVLRPGGHLIIRVPEAEDLSVYAWDQPQKYEYIHLRRFDPSTMWLLLEKIHGLRVQEILPVNYPGWNELHAVAVKP